jgi:hypothetical protein
MWINNKSRFNTRFFIRGVCKKNTYAVKIRDFNHLRQRIIAAVATVTLDMLHRTWKETKSAAWMFAELQMLLTLGPITTLQ